MKMIQKIKSLWHTIFTIDVEAINELKEILEFMQSLSNEDREILGKPLKK